MQEFDKKWSLAEFMADQADMLEMITQIPRLERMSLSEEQLLDVSRSNLVWKPDGTLWCTICRKCVPTGKLDDRLLRHDTHINSPMHQTNVKTVIKLDFYLGKPLRGIRELGVGIPAGRVSRRSVAHFWGDDAERFAFKGLQKLRQTGVRVKVGKREVHVKGEHIKSCSPAVVNYFPGHKKYSNSRCVLWAGLPETGADDGTESGFAADQQQQEIGGQQTWWPVLQVTFAPGTDGVVCAAGLWDPEGGTWLVCIYQMLDSLPAAWFALMAKWAEMRADDMEDGPPPEPAPRIPVLRLRGAGPPPPQPAQPDGPYPSEGMEMID